MTPPYYLSAATLLARLREGSISIEETVRAFLKHIAAHNPAINAITHLRSEEDLLQEARFKDQQLKAGTATGKLFGLPMTVKDTFQTKGLITSTGHPFYRSHIPDTDAELVSRLKAAGAILLGKTNLPLFSFDWQSRNPWFGCTNNPHDLARVPGGSSGGSAASLAAGFSPLELGSDAGGSIRVPAHFCGVCGLRPSEQALSNRGLGKLPGKAQGGRYIVVSGPMARNVGDLDLMMNVLTTPAKPGENPPEYDYHASTWDGSRLAIAYAATLNNIPVDNEYAALFAGFIDTLRQTHHQVEEDAVRIDDEQAMLTHTTIIGRDIDAVLKGVPFSKLGTYLFFASWLRSHTVGKGLRRGISMSDGAFQAALERKNTFSSQFTRFFENYDVWITPVCALPAFSHQPTGRPFRVNGKRISYMDAIGKFTFPTALSGHPILVIPIGQTQSGLPVGVQVHARWGEDKRLLQIGAFLESLAPGFMPPIQTLE